MHTDRNHDWGVRPSLKLRSAYNYVDQVNKDQFLYLHATKAIGDHNHKFKKSIKQLSSLNKAPLGDFISDRELVSNMLFLAPNLTDEQQWKDLQHVKEVLPDPKSCSHLLNKLEFRKRSNFIYGAIDALNTYDSQTDSRLSCGMMESTLATEYKRKKIMSALLDLGYNTSSEKAITDRINTQDKLLLYFSLYCGKEGEDEDNFKIVRENALKAELKLVDREVPPLVETLVTSGPQHLLQTQKLGVTINSPCKTRKLVQRQDHLLLSPIQPQRSKHKLLSDKHRFKAKWSEYDVMRSRWLSVQSQVKQLKSAGNIIAPLSTKEEGQVVLDDGTVIKGTVIDAEYFKKKIAESRRPRPLSRGE